MRNWEQFSVQRMSCFFVDFRTIFCKRRWSWLLIIAIGMIFCIYCFIVFHDFQHPHQEKDSRLLTSKLNWSESSQSTECSQNEKSWLMNQIPFLFDTVLNFFVFRNIDICQNFFWRRDHFERCIRYKNWRAEEKSRFVFSSFRRLFV